jgi:hypothetical protein
MDTNKENRFIYDTPTGMIEKQGRLYKGMSTYDPNRSVFVKCLTIFFSLVILILPGAALTYLGGMGIFSLVKNGYSAENFQILLIFIFGVPMLVGGIKVILVNIKK